jgi:hypothetical protein
MKVLISVVIIAILISGCTPSEKSIKVAVSLTQTAYPTSTSIPPTPTATATPAPTQDLRVIDIDPQKLLLEKSDLPLECSYYLPGPGWISPLRNSEIVSEWTVEKGKAYLADTGRIDGWVVYYRCRKESALLPDEIFDNVVIYSSVEGAHVMYAKYLERKDDGFLEITDAPKVGDFSIAWIKNNAGGEGKNQYLFDFTYKNILHTVGIWGSEQDVKFELAVSIAQDLLSKLQKLPLSSEVLFRP